MSKVLMVTGMVLAFMAGTAHAGDPPKGNAKAKGLEKFQGTWVLVSGETGGRPIPERAIKAAKVEIKDGTMTVFINGKRDSQQKLTIEPTMDPKQIDMTRQYEDRKETAPGIYTFVGDTLKLCVDDACQDRPTKFRTTKDTPKHSLLELKRAKP